VNASGVALLWVGLLRYVEHNQSYFSVVLTLRRGVPRVLRYLVRPTACRGDRSIHRHVPPAFTLNASMRPQPARNALYGVCLMCGL
jgi:hypothetical protein